MTEQDIRDALLVLFVADDNAIRNSLIAMGWTPPSEAPEDVAERPATQCKSIHEWKANDLAGITRGDRWW